MNWRTFLKLARWLLALLAMIIAYRLGQAGVKTGETVGGIGGANLVFVGVGSLIFGVILIAPEAIHLISMPIQAMFGGIFFPGRVDTPPPDYNLSKSYREQGRYEEAIAHYHAIIHNHPQELLAYIEGIETAYLNETPEEAQKFYQIALRKLEAEVAREQVHKALMNPPELPVAEEAVPDAPEGEAVVAGAGDGELPPWRQPGAAEAPAEGEGEEIPPWRRAEATPAVPEAAEGEAEDELPPWLREAAAAEAELAGEEAAREDAAGDPQPGNPPPADGDERPPWRQ